MKAEKIILWCIVILVLVYGGVLVAERMTRQELTRLSVGQAGETVCLMWQPRLLRGGGVCSIDLLNAQGRVVDSATMRVLDTGFDALQQFGQLSAEEQTLTVSSLHTGELAQRFVVKDGRLNKVD